MKWFKRAGMAANPAQALAAREGVTKSLGSQIAGAAVALVAIAIVFVVVAVAR
jgi:hypothetical protein